MNNNKPNVFINPNWENHSLIRDFCNAGFNIIGYGERLDPKNGKLPSYRHMGLHNRLCFNVRYMQAIQCYLSCIR